jgi:hypothetical protein
VRIIDNIVDETTKEDEQIAKELKAIKHDCQTLFDAKTVKQ